MTQLKERLFKDLSDAVVEMDEEKAITVSTAIVENNIDAYEAIEKGLSDGMNRAGFWGMTQRQPFIQAGFITKGYSRRASIQIFKTS